MYREEKDAVIKNNSLQIRENYGTMMFTGMKLKINY